MQKYYIPEDRRPCYYFPGVDEFLSYTSPTEMLKRGRRDVALDANCEKWGGGLTYSAAHKLAQTGAYMNPAMLELRDKLVAQIRPTVEPVGVWDVSGGSTIDMGAFLSGEPECVLNYRDESARSRKSISLIYNACVSGGVNVEVLRLRGVAFLALVDAIETSKKYRTNVYYVASNDGGGGVPRNAMIIRAKGTEGNYDPQALGFALAHPGMFRKLTFGFWSTLGGLWHGSMGSVHTLTTLPVELGESEAMATAGGMLGDYVNTDAIYNYASAVRWVVDRLAEYGIEAQVPEQTE